MSQDSNGDERSYPIFLVIGMVAGMAIGDALGGGGVATVGLIIGGAMGRLIDGVVREKRTRSGMGVTSWLTVAYLAAGVAAIVVVALAVRLLLGGAPLLLTIVSALAGLVLALLSVSLGVIHLRRHRSSRVLASVGIALSLLVAGLAAVCVLAALFMFETPHESVLADLLGYEATVIDNPLQVELFRADGQPEVWWLYSGAIAPLGWYSEEQEGEIPLDIPRVGVGPTDSVAFDPGGSAFGFRMKYEPVYEWYSESARNRDGASHVKVYPAFSEGREVPNAYVVCWEDYPLNEGPSQYIDFTDLIFRVDGVVPVYTEEGTATP